MTALAKKSILARLLARENITVEQTNHHTAFFDVERRILGLPYFKDVGNDLYDLLVGHEIGHALHTPAAGWHSSTIEIPGCPRSYVNIVEDIRIEKLVLREFPGLLGSFMRGYQDLLDRDFFGIKNENVDTLSFMNRLNIFAKSRGLVNIKFNSKEQPYVDRAMAVETWEDVMASCRELYEFMKAELEAARRAQEELDEMLKSAGIKPTQSGIPDKIVITASKETGEGQPQKMSDELKEAIMNGDVEIEIDVDSFKNADPEEAKTEEVKAEEGDDSISISTIHDVDDNIEGVETDAIFRAAIANALVDTIGAGGKTIYGKGPSKKLVNSIVVPYEKVASARRIPTGDNFPHKRFVRFTGTMKDSVAVMVKEFEMKKTARRFARARTSTKGSLDVNALHRYKYDDQLFKQVTHLDDDQSHGMIMLIDYSGSMSSIIQKVLKQLMVLITFCKRVNVPFEVYGFTNPNSGHYGELQRQRVAVKSDLTSVAMDNVHVFKLIDSSMKKAVYEEAYRSLYLQTTSKKYMGTYEGMSGTPLDQAILTMYHRIEDFKTKHNVQKMNFITLTDGAGEGLHFASGIDMPKGVTTSGTKRVIDIMGQKITLGNYGETTPALLNGLRKLGVRTMNYHMIAASQIIYEREDIRNASKEVKEAAIAQMKKDGYCVIDNKNGYDRQIFTCLVAKETLASSTSQNDDEDDEEDIEAEISDLAEGFTAQAFKKKRDRLIAAKFAEVIS